MNKGSIKNSIIVKTLNEKLVEFAKANPETKPFEHKEMSEITECLRLIDKFCLDKGEISEDIKNRKTNGGVVSIESIVYSSVSSYIKPESDSISITNEQYYFILRSISKYFGINILNSHTILEQLGTVDEFVSWLSQKVEDYNSGKYVESIYDYYKRRENLYLNQFMRF